MGYGLGVFLTVLGLILALAVQDMVDAIDLTMIGWILVLAGVLVLVLTAVQANARRQHTTHATTTHSDGSQTTEQRTTERQDPPPAV
jgi:membrane protein implicated in regulation of membrane protease activity